MSKLGKHNKEDKHTKSTTQMDVFGYTSLPRLVTHKLIGVGTSNKTMRAFLAELRGGGVTLVVDIRDRPLSQFRPWFNRNHLQESLRRAKIDYLWAGDLLGNKKDLNGNRSLDGFIEYMQTSSYEKGIALLKAQLKSARGAVALVCSEGREEECHRSLILKDVAGSERRKFV